MTKFDRLVLTLISSFKGERTVSAVFHLLNGKRSGQTIQDVEYYKLKPYFSILPKMKKELFDKMIDILVNNSWIELDDSTAIVTAKGREKIAVSENFHYNGWVYRGKEWVFFYRLSLIVQTLSHSITNDFSFIPVQKDEKIQQFARSFLKTHPYRNRNLIASLKVELSQSLLKCEMADSKKNLIVHRLVGKDVSGWTWRQMADEIECSEMDVYCSFIEALHIWLDVLFSHYQQFPLLYEIARDCKISNPLTDSAAKTSRLFVQGYTMGQIAEMRKLKMSTIEDHFVEMAINDPDFPIHQFLQDREFNEIQEFVQKSGTKKLRLLKENLPGLSYFQLRLGLAFGGGAADGQHPLRPEGEVRI